MPAEVLNAHSDGVKDLRFGYTTDNEWQDRDPDEFLLDNRDNAPLLEGVGYYFLAATVSRTLEHPWGHLVGDVLVRLPSAAGYSEQPDRRIPFRSGRLFGSMNHFQLASHPDVYAVIGSFIVDAEGAAAAPASRGESGTD